MVKRKRHLTHGGSDVGLIMKTHGGDHSQLVEGTDRVVPLQQWVSQLRELPPVLDKRARLEKKTKSLTDAR